MTTLISENLQAGLVVQGLRKSYQKNYNSGCFSIVKRRSSCPAWSEWLRENYIFLCNSGSDPGDGGKYLWMEQT